MRILFLGSPIEAVAPLEALLASKHDIVAVVSQPARPAGRKRKLCDPPVAQFANEKGISLFQPERASGKEFLQALRGLGIDVAVTAAYGQILTDEFLAIPKRATINIHPSLLPSFRGATPVQSALLGGLSHTGVTILFTVRQLDAGALILQREFAIGARETSAQLLPRLFRESGPMVVEGLQLLEDLDFRGTPQDEAAVTHCRKIEKSDGEIIWGRSAQETVNRYRAYDPWPGTYSFCQGKRVQFRGVTNSSFEASVGEASFCRDSQCVLVACGEGGISVAELKPAGKGWVSARDFWNAYSQESGVVFEQG